MAELFLERDAQNTEADFIVEEQPKEKRRVLYPNSLSIAIKSRKWNDDYLAFGFYLPYDQMKCLNQKQNA